MRYAIFADIHGNLEALHAALEYTQKHHLNHYIVLGDSIGYGADPNACYEWAQKHAEYHVLGNHEAAVLHEKIRWEFNDWARVAIDWTAERLSPGWLQSIKELPYLQIHQDMTFSHGTIHDPEHFHYLVDPSDALRSFLALQTQIGFVGHSHIPCSFLENAGTGGYLEEGRHRLIKGERYLLNPGSIGQPRDRDPRLSFGVFDDHDLTFEIVRLSYDNKKAAAKIRAEGLPAFLADRLL